jgi:hypothetical protein
MAYSPHQVSRFLTSASPYKINRLHHKLGSFCKCTFTARFVAWREGYNSGESMTSLLLFALLARGEAERLARLTTLVAQSGRVVEIAVPPSDRLRMPQKIAPGAPPLVSFRLFDGRMRHRFSNLDLVLDDAGH